MNEQLLKDFTAIHIAMTFLTASCGLFLGILIGICIKVNIKDNHLKKFVERR